jgi:DNA-binding NarL/FixJ family response regulator
VPLRCLIVDDNPVFLASARRLLESEGLLIVGAVSSAEAGLRLAAEARPDVALVDVELGEDSGVELSRRLISAARPVPVILISTYPEEDLTELIASSPAAGFIAKSQLSAETVRAMLG